jgi:hypothetical protein
VAPRGIDERGEEGEQASERGEVRALARREVLDPAAEAALAVSRAEVHHECALRGDCRFVAIGMA